MNLIKVLSFGADELILGRYRDYDLSDYPDNYYQDVELVESVTVQPVLIDNNKLTYYLCCQDHIIKNIRMPNNIKTAQLLINGKIVDEIESGLFPLLRHVFQIDESIIPFFSNSVGIPYDVTVILEVSEIDDKTLTYDIMSYKDTGPGILDGKMVIFFCTRALKHPTYYIIASCNEEIPLEIKAKCFSLPKTPFTLECTHSVGQHTLYKIGDPFLGGINFSNVWWSSISAKNVWCICAKTI